jgi:signal transduction histidine kinase
MRLTILQKGLLVIAIPILVEAVLIGVLMRNQTERDRDLRWAVHTKEVVAKVEAFYRRLIEGTTPIRVLAVSAFPASAEGSRQALVELPEEIAELKRLVADNPQQQSRIDQLAAESQALIDWQAQEERRAQAGERGAEPDRVDAAARNLAAARSTLDAVRVAEDDLDRLRMQQLARSAGRQRSVMLFGGLALLAANLLLAYLFLRGVIKGLTVLRDNTLRFACGQDLRAPLTGHDEIADLDRAFHDMASNLQEQRQENEMFVYSVSHDLRSPLINLQGFSEELSLTCGELEALFRHEEIPPPVRRHGLSLLADNIASSLGYIQTAVGRLARIIDALLRLSRAGRVEYQWQLINISALVDKIVDSLRDSIAGKKAEVSVARLPPAWGDPTAVEQILANLIANAVEYTDPERPGRIEVGYQGEGPSGPGPGPQVYYVKDNGVGIPEAYRERLFTPFSRFHADRAQGEGVGLALVRRMVERHGGKIWMEPSDGAGSTFFFSLPDSAPNESKRDGEKTPLTHLERKGYPTWQPNRS